VTSTLQVNLGNILVGTLTMLPSGSIVFTFEESYLNKSQRPVLSQSFFRPSGELIPETKLSRVKLPAFFSNLLPEGQLRKYLAQLGDIKPTQEFRLIELLGKDLPGSVIVKAIEGSKFKEENTQNEEQTEISEAYRFSLAGVQLKFSAITKKNGGLTIPAKGVGGNWIIKLPAQNYAYVPENEWSMMHLAQEIGIPTPETNLISLDQIEGLPDLGALSGKHCLAVKRFDRADNGQRIHIEDFAQVYNIYPEKKYQGISYENIANMVWILTGESGLTDFIRRLTFAIITGNGDMHLKNWSFIYEDGHAPTLSPAYDLVSTVPYIPKDTLALKLAGHKDMRSITLEHFKKLIIKAQIPEYIVLQTVKETVEATLGAWNHHYKNYNLPNEIQDRIQQHMKSLLLT